jgi:hypothetical protein
MGTLRQPIVNPIIVAGFGNKNMSRGDQPGWQVQRTGHDGYP